MEIIFVMNFLTESIEKNQYKRLKLIFEASLQKLFPPKFGIAIFPIKLYTQIGNEEDNLHKI